MDPESTTVAPTAENEKPTEEVDNSKAETPKAPSEGAKPEVKVTAELREKYGKLSTDELLTELAKWTGTSRFNEQRSKENYENLTAAQAALTEAKKDAEKASTELTKVAAELAEMKAEKAALELTAIRTKHLAAAGLDPEADAVFISGADEEAIKASVAALAARVGAGATKEPTRTRNVIPEAGTPKEVKNAPFGDRYKQFLTSPSA